MSDHKIELSAAEFVRAMEHRIAIDINGQNQYFNNFEISNVLVEEPVSLTDLTLAKRLKLKNCTLKDLSVFDCKFLEYFYIENCTINTFGITNSTFNSLATFGSGINWYSVYKATIKKEFRITNINSRDGIFLDGIVCDTDIVILAGKVSNLEIMEVTAKNLSLSQVIVEKDISVGRKCILEKAHILYNVINNSCIISDCTISSLDLSNNEVKNSIEITSACTLETLNIKENNFTKILSITNSRIQRIQLSSVQEKMTIILANLEIQTINISNGFSNLGYMQWNNLKLLINSKISICNAIMGKWDIINCNLSTADIAIYSSKITDAFYTNSKFPIRLSLPNEILENEIRAHEIRRDGYNQLKTLAQKQNDRKSFLHFQAAELRSYYDTLNWNWEDGSTKFQLWAQKWSSDYGTKWTWGVICVLGFNFLFVSISSADKIWKPDGAGIGNYFTGYCASLFSLITVPKYFYTDWEIIWFYISRLFIAFGIYQTIAAFRKFGKSE